MKGSVEKTKLVEVSTDELKSKLQQCTTDEEREALVETTNRQSPNTVLLYLTEQLVEISGDESQTEKKAHLSEQILQIFLWHAYEPILTEQTLRTIKEPLLKLDNTKLKVQLLTTLMKLPISHPEESDTLFIDLRLELDLFDTSCSGATNLFFDIKDQSLRNTLFHFLIQKGFDAAIDDETRELFIRINKKARDHKDILANPGNSRGFSLNETFDQLTVILNEFCQLHSVQAEFNFANTDAYIAAFETFFETTMETQTNNKREDYLDLSTSSGIDPQSMVKRLKLTVDEFSVRCQTFNFIVKQTIQPQRTSRRDPAPHTQPTPSAEARYISTDKSKNLKKHSDVVINPFKPRSRSFLVWLFTTSYLTFISIFINNNLLQNAKNRHNFIDDTPSGFSNFLKLHFLVVFGFDGYNTIENKALAANGQYETIDISQLGWGILFLSFIGFPNRPECIVNGRPILRLGQFFSNFVGGWTLNAKTWTSTEIIELPFKFGLVLPIKIISIFFKLAINLTRILTEAVPNILSYSLIFIALIPTVFWGILFGSKKSLPKSEPTTLVLITAIIAILITVPLAFIQYASVWLVRIGKLLTSPAESASNAFAAGRSLKIDWFGETVEEGISIVMGVMGWLVSFGLTALLWTFIAPLAISAITTSFPAIIAAIAWFTSLPIITASIAWATQFLVVTTLGAQASGLITTVGSALGVAFGPTILWMAGLVGLKVSTLAMTCTAIGLLGAPIVIIGNHIADKASEIWVYLHSSPVARRSRSETILLNAVEEGKGSDDRVALLSKDVENLGVGFRNLQKSVEQRDRDASKTGNAAQHPSSSSWPKSGFVSTTTSSGLTATPSDEANDSDSDFDLWT